MSGSGPSRRTVNVWVAFAMPVIMVGLVGYATWVFVAKVCSLKYLLLSQQRKATAVILLTLYFISFLLLSSSYFKVVWTINTDPGYVEKGSLIPSPADGEGSTQAREKDEFGNGRGNVLDDLEAGLGGGSGPRVISGSVGMQDLSPPATAAESDGESMIGALNDGPQTTAHYSPPHRFSTVQPPPSPAPTEALGSNPFQTPTSNTLLKPERLDAGSAGTSITQGHSYGNWGPARPTANMTPENLSEWYNREAFVCESDGLPRWCSRCNCWKPDRTHHCSEIDRCVLRMDHFCPWVGGVVAEPSYKYFYQVVVYGTIYCLFLIISLAVLLNERDHETGNVDSTWVATIGIASLFCLFAAGMTGSTSQLIYRNVSTIDSLGYTTKVYQLAIHDPNPLPEPPQPVPESEQLLLQIPGRVWLPRNPTPGQETRCFVIVKTQPGENPWRLPSTLENFKQVLGESIWEWGLPWGRSPLSRKDSAEGWYKWNDELLDRLRKEAGIERSQSPS